MFGPKQLK